MVITIEELAGGITKVILEGKLDVENAGAVESGMKEIAFAHKSILVDLQNVSFLGSTGLRALVAPAVSLQSHGGKMVLFAPNEMVARVLKVSGIESMVPVHQELRNALAAFQ
jgi:anti-anti-sigma factor